MSRRCALICSLLLATTVRADDPAKIDSRQALQPLQGLVATWKGTGTPEGTREERQNFWIENDTWVWQFKDGGAFLAGKFDGGRYFIRGEIRPTSKDHFQLTVETPTKQKLAFEGELKEGRLTLERTDEKTKENQRLVFRLLHSNRIVYQYEVQPAGRTSYSRKYVVGLTNQSEPFASSANTEIECIVSGGKGTIPVSYKGVTYYVCCTGCRDEFKANPEKYIAEYEARKKEKAGKPKE